MDTLELDLFIGRKLKFYRNKLNNLSLTTLAEKLDISFQQLHRYENGVNKIPSSILYKISQIMEIPIDKFFEGYKQDVILDDEFTYNIFLVEDDLDNEMLFRKALNDYEINLQIYAIHNEDEIINLFRKIDNEEEISTVPKPDIIFIDICKPHGKILSLIKSIKSKKITKNIPLIVLSNNLEDTGITEAYNLHANGFIKKSFEFDNYKSQIQQTLVYWSETVMLPS
jgi:CheY-like chemotaxis protein